VGRAGNPELPIRKWWKKRSPAFWNLGAPSDAVFVPLRRVVVISIVGESAAPGFPPHDCDSLAMAACVMMVKREPQGAQTICPGGYKAVEGCAWRLDLTDRFFISVSSDCLLPVRFRVRNDLRFPLGQPVVLVGEEPRGQGGVVTGITPRTACQPPH